MARDKIQDGRLFSWKKGGGGMTGDRNRMGDRGNAKVKKGRQFIKPWYAGQISIPNYDSQL